MFEWEKKTFDYVNNSLIYQKLKIYVELININNDNFNLTGFDEKTIWRDGIYQSIVLLDKFINFKSQKIKLLDIGSGVGFPSIPFFIFANNKIELTIYEPIKKRIIFLNLVKDKLNLKNIKIVNKRIEDEENFPEKFDCVTARAVMPLNMLIEVSSKCGNLGCKYVFLKSKNIYQELKESDWIINRLSIKDIKITKVDLDDKKEHNVCTYTKMVETPKQFPRKWSEIKRNNKIR